MGISKKRLSTKEPAAKKASNKKPGISKTSLQKPFYLICVGASAGGLDAVIELVSQFPTSLNAAVCIVMHLPATITGEVFAAKIRQNTGLECNIAEDNQDIKPGHIYFAGSGSHMLVKQGKIVIGNGPSENRFKPSIDVLFRSAAANYTTRAIGIVLTGFLNDGTSGMWAIRESGGYCIVQHPDDAKFPDMPQFILNTLQVDFSIPVEAMGEILEQIISKNPGKAIVPPPNIVAESRVSEKAATGIEHMLDMGERAPIGCPDCGGGIWEIKQKHGIHYRCQIGHSYSEEDFIVKLAENIDHTLWVAVRMMEERKLVLQKHAKEHKLKSRASLSSQYYNQAESLEEHISKLKELLFSLIPNNNNATI